MEPPLNMDRMREASLNDPEFMFELIDIFLDDTPIQVGILRQAVDSQDPEAVTSAAHRVKGASSNLGAESLAALCARLEEDGRAGQADSLGSLMNGVDDEFERVKVFLGDVRAGRV